MKRLLFGGSFDPFHAGHLAVADGAFRATRPDRLVLVPAASSPHKDGTSAPPEDRLEMCRLAVAGDPRFEVLDAEIRRGGRSYTYDTVQELLAGAWAGDSLAVLVGQDVLGDLPRWRDARALAALVPIFVVSRPDAADPDWEALAAGLGREAADGLRTRFLRLPPSRVSSTEVRRRVREGKSIRCWVPDPVADYIEARGLYR